MDDAQLHPPDIEGREPMEARGGERGSIVGANRVRQPHRAEQGAEHGLGEGGLHRGEPVTHQQGTAEVIRHRQGITIAGIARLEVPFEIGGPDLVRAHGLHRRGPRMRPLPSASVFS